MSVQRKSSGVWQISTGGRRRRRANAPRLPPAQRRTQLLDAALGVVARDGLARLTMQAVAQEAGVAKPVLYAMFPTAPELVAALLHREHAAGMAQVLAAMPANLGGTDPDAEFVAAMMAFLDSVAADPPRWRLILLPGDGAPASYRELLGAARDEMVGRAIALLDDGLRLRGGPVEVDVELIGHMTMGCAEVLGRMVLSDPRRFPPTRLRPAVCALLRTLPRPSG
ncbi:TetR/AcrR family transcriptional regulator [Nocardia mangyaensis]|uniref:TetR/AcrR family transcriptional regulator n=1 Tax=Nocardia mangyaensis TaxID=2213200 RepID=UPI00143157B0|nr:TetR/AcrR family transcriptional regulator [Nocardia mangyaensis]